MSSDEGASAGPRDVVQDLVSITGLSEEEAAVLLEAAGGNLEHAVQLHFDNEDAAAGGTARDAEMAAAAAAGYYEDSDFGGGGRRSSDDDDVTFGGVADGGGGRRARSPAPAPRAGGEEPPPSRWRVALAWIGAYLPVYSFAARVGRLLSGTGILGFLSSLLWAPLALVGLVGANPQPRAPAAAVQQFEAWFEETIGRVHPRFFRGSCQAALSRSKTDARFVLAYLHDARMPECTAFCERVLSSALVQTFVDDNFVFWVRPPPALRPSWPCSWP